MMLGDEYDNENARALREENVRLRRELEEARLMLQQTPTRLALWSPTAEPELGLLATASSFAQQAVKSWRSISGAELTFVPTPNKSRPEVPAVAPPSQSEGFEEALEQLHVALASEPPDFTVAAVMALRMVEIVGESQIEDQQDSIRLELAEASTRKVSSQVLAAVKTRMEEARGTKSWRECLRETAHLTQTAARLGAAEEAAGLVASMGTEGVRADSEEWLLWVRCKDEFEANGIVSATAEVLRGTVEFATLAEESLGKSVARGGPGDNGGAVGKVAQEAAKALCLLLSKLLDTDRCVWSRPPAAADADGGEGSASGEGGAGPGESEEEAAVELLTRMFEYVETAQARLDDGLLTDDLSELLSSLLDMLDALQRRNKSPTPPSAA